MSLKKSNFIDAINSQIGLSKAEAREFVDEFFEFLTAALEAGDSIHLQSFGRFKLLDKAVRVGRNPKTGEEHCITARRVVSFNPSPSLTARINSQLYIKQNSESDDQAKHMVLNVQSERESF